MTLRAVRNEFSMSDIAFIENVRKLNARASELFLRNSLRRTSAPRRPRASCTWTSAPIAT